MNDLHVLRDAPEDEDDIPCTQGELRGRDIDSGRPSIDRWSKS
jgi:hypothetical protein